MVVKYLQTKSTTTTYGISSSSTTIQLKKLLKLDGTSVAASDIGDLLYGTFSPGTSREEIFSIDGANVTIETDGKVTITGITRGLREVSPYTTGGYSCDHPAGEVVIFGNNPQIYQYLKDYIDDAVIGQGIKASEVLYGISKLSVAPASSTEPIVVGDNDPRIPTTAQTDAMDGSQGVPNADNKYVTEDNVYTGEADQSQTTQNGTVEFGMVNTSTNKNIICQSFIPTKTKIRGIKLYKSADTGTHTGTVTVALFADSSGSPTGSALATVTITNSVYSALPVGEFEAEFSAEYSMTVGTLYWFKVSSSTADSSNHPNLGTNTAGGYANGSVKYYNGTDGYVAVATIDLYFKTLQGVNSQVIKSDTTGKMPETFYDITKMPTPFLPQDIPLYVGTAFDMNKASFATTMDGSVGVVSWTSGSTGLTIKRIEKDPKSLNYYITHEVSLSSVDGFEVSSITIIGNYVYIPWYDNPSPKIKRYDLADLGNATDMTFSGTGYYSQSFTDGVNIYMYRVANTYVKFTISGTTVTNAGDVVYTGLGTPTLSCGDSAGFVYFTTSTGNDQVSIITKYGVSGGAVVSTKSIGLISDAYVTTNLASFFKAQTGLLGIGMWFRNESNTSITGTSLRLNAITLP